MATCNKCICCSFNDGIATLATVINAIAANNDDTCEAGATTERFISNTCYTTRNFKACDAGAITERIASYRCYAIGNFNAFEAGAIIERPISYACYTTRNFNAFEAGTITERTVSYACYAVWDNGILATCNKCICCSFNDGIATLAAVIYTIVRINNYACEAGAIAERAASYRCYAIGNYNAC